MTETSRKARAGTARRTGATTISDVAAAAGVSPMTVSRVINAQKNVRDSTREAVHQAIEKLNYSPNRAARQLASASQVRVGLLYNNPSEAYLSKFLVGSLEQATRAEIQLIVQNTELRGREREMAQRLIDSGVDGIVLPPPLCDSVELLQMLIEAGIPTVAVATNRQMGDVATVSIDDRGAAYRMTRHLLDLGHERIGFITGDPILSASAERRFGYLEALADSGIDPDPALVEEGMFTYRSGLNTAESLLDLEDRPTAIFASNDDMAAATVAVAHQRGLDVPGDLSVVGFDDSALATTIWPELTTIRQPIADMSRAAMDYLAARLNGNREHRITALGNHIVLDYALIRRQSDAPPRRRPSSSKKSA